MSLFRTMLHSLIFVFSIFSSHRAYSVPPIDASKCFSGYLEESADSPTYKAIDYIPWCLDSIRGTSPGSTTVNEHFIELESLKDRMPDSLALVDISRRAASVFYSDKYCDKNNYKKYGVFCGKLGKFARVHASGRYNYNCSLRASAHSKCSEFSLLIIDKKERICNSGLMEKNYCNELITGFLSSSQCSPSSSTEDCQKHIDTQLTLARGETKDPCARESHSVMDLSLCTGGDGKLTTASVDPENPDATGGDDSGADSDNSETTTGNEDVDALRETAAKVGDQVFGNIGKLNNYGYEGNEINSPDVDGGSNLQAQSSGGGQLSNPDGSSMGQMSPSNTLADMMTPNPGGPTGGTPSGQPGGQAGAGPRGGGGAGSFSGGGGGSGGGKGNGRRQGGRRYSPKSEISKKMGQRFYGATGSPSSGGSGLTTKLSPKIKKALEKNKANDLAKRNVGQINAAFQAGLKTPGQGGADAFISPLYFPGMDEGIQYIKDRKAHLNDGGYEF